MSDKFKQYIDGAERIYITSHTSPDPDAVSSVLLLGSTLKLNFPDKKIEMGLEEEAEGLDFLASYNELVFKNLAETIQELKPDLIILVDANSFERCSRKDGLQVKNYAAKNSVKTAIIDHHEPEGKDDTDVYINSGNLACVQEVYELCFGQMGLKKPAGWTETTMLGLYADTGGFVYPNPRYQETLKLIGELVAGGANIEAIKNRLSQYSEEQMKVIAELASNATHNDDYSYSFISDDFMKKWLDSGKTIASLHTATKPFIDNYIRSIDGRLWGFLVYLDPLEGDGFYSVSLRAQGGVKDVSQIAGRLSGGGHKPAAGGKVQADSIQEAIDKIKEVIAST